MSQSAIIAIGIFSIELGLVCLYLNKLAKDMEMKISENSLKNSQIDLLQRVTLNVMNENKHIKTERDDAMNDAVRLHKSNVKLTKAIQNGVGTK